MSEVRMLNPKDGNVYAFDERYAAEYAGKGWRPDPASAISTGGSPEERANRERAAASRQILPGPHYFRDMASQAVPSLAAGLATAAVPEAAPLAILTKLALAFGAGTGGELGGQAIRREPLDLGRAAMRGGLESVATGAGEALVPFTRMAARLPEDLGAAALAPPTRLGLKSAGPTGGPTGLQVALREGVMPGPPLLYKGTSEMESRLAASQAAERATVEHFEAQAKSSPARELGKGVSRTVPEVNLSQIASKAYQNIVERMGPALKPAAKVELQSLTDEMSTRALSNVEGRPIEIPQTPKDIWRLKRSLDSPPTRERLRAAQATPKSDMEDAFEKEVANEARAWLRVNVPGLGRQMQRTSELMRAEPMIAYAESQPVVASREGAFAAARDLTMTRERMGKAALRLRGTARLAETPATRGAVRQAPRALGLGIDEALQLLKGRAYQAPDTARTGQ